MYANSRNETINDIVKRFIDKNELRDDISSLNLSGINLLKSDGEIKQALDKISCLLLHHPLGNHKTDIEKIGYKLFFNWISKNNLSLTKDTIDKHLADYKEQHNHRNILENFLFWLRFRYGK